MTAFRGVIMEAPDDNRSSHVAEWLGTTTVVWGGGDPFDGPVNSGGRYDPSTNTWAATSVGAGVPAARSNHTGVASNGRLIVWGGLATPGNSGGVYDPTTNSWSATSVGAGVPTERHNHAAQWSGTEMLVWGGIDRATQQRVNTGGRYDPSTNSWSTISTGTNVPSPRDLPATVWANPMFIVWGGGSGLNTGGTYLPASNTWMTTTTVGAPAARRNHTAVWTGSRMIIWGGSDLSTGGLYCPPACATYYADVDQDAFGSAATSTVNCTGTPPAGYVTVAGDCNDGNPDVHPGAPEICNGIDDDCNDQIDERPVPAAPSALTVDRTGVDAQVSWTAVVDATGYDVVFGTLSSLLGEHGNFTASVGGCLGDDVAVLSVTDFGEVVSGDGNWYLVRAVSCTTPGSYDEPPGRQAGTRDGEIQASASACP